MQSISYDTAKNHKLIRFMTPGPFLTAREAFYLKDGDRIRVASGHDGSVTSHLCKYIDPTHFSVSHAIFHMDQFAELMGKSKSTYEPETPITDLSLYEEKYFDRALKDADGKRIPYHEIIVLNAPASYHQPSFSISICPDADSHRTVCITKQMDDTAHQIFMSFQQLQECISGELYSILNHWDRKVLSSVLHEQYLLQNQSSLQNKLNKASISAAHFDGGYYSIQPESPSR